MLAPNRKSNLRQQAINFQVNNPADELVASTDLPVVGSPVLNRAALGNRWQKAIQLSFRYTVMPAWRSYRLDLSFIDPLLQSRITYPQNSAGVTNGI
jgi:hypothetical protein